MPGEPANAYVFTLTPAGSDAITFSLVADQSCAAGGICSADGTVLTVVPAPLVIGPPVTVGFGATTYPTTEGGFAFVSVRLSAPHQGVREVTVPVVVASESTASPDEFSEPPNVSFAAGEREQTFTILVTPDALDEGAETVRLGLGDLPPGITAGTNATTTVHVADGEVADIRFSADRGEVSEGGEVRLTFAIANAVTFERTETIDLAIAGTATPGVDFTVVDEGGRALSAPYAIAFPPGVSSVTATVHVTDDADAEPDEDISITASFARRDTPLGTGEIVVAASDGPGCLRGDIAVGFSLVVYEGGSVEELEDCTRSRHVTALYTLHEGVYVSYILGAPDFVNEAFRELYPDGLPALTPLVAGGNGPPSADPLGDDRDGAGPQPWPECLRGDVVEGFSLAVYEGGSVEELEACAESQQATVLYALHGGEWVSYILGAPDFANAGFRELFPDGLPVLMPLVARSDGPAEAN